LKVSDGKYSHARHVDRVLKASKSRCAARTVLLEACRRADFGKPETTVTKNQLEEVLGYSRKTIQHALKVLKDEGSLLPVRNVEGGRGKAVTYRLQVIEAMAVAGVEDEVPEAAPQPGAEPDEVAALRAWFETIDPNGYNAWIKALQFEEISAGLLVMKAPSAFHADHINAKFADRLRDIAGNLPENVQKVKVRA
jgi:hypothetical protein